MKFEITLDVLEEMAECIHNCSWVSDDEIFAWMKGCVTGSADYDPEEWSVDGRGQVAKPRDIIEQEFNLLEDK